MHVRKFLVALILLQAVPVVAWAAFKPIRVLAPELLGLHCTAQGVCIDDVRRLPEAKALRDEALVFVSSRVGRL